jgi:hypothetical protein
MKNILVEYVEGGQIYKFNFSINDDADSKTINKEAHELSLLQGFDVQIINVLVVR